MIVKIEHALNENLKYGQVLNDKWIVLEVLMARAHYTKVLLSQPGFTELLSIREPTVAELLELREAQIKTPPPKDVLEFLDQLKAVNSSRLGIMFEATLLDSTIKVRYSYIKDGEWTEDVEKIVTYGEIRPLFHEAVANCNGLVR